MARLCGTFPGLVNTLCMSCRLQFRHALRYPVFHPVFHPIEILARAYSTGDERPAGGTSPG